MIDCDKTIRMTSTFPSSNISDDLLLTVFDGTAHPRTFRLNSFGKANITFGRGDFNDIVLTSPLVSTEHGRFTKKMGNGLLKTKLYLRE